MFPLLLEMETGAAQQNHKIELKLVKTEVCHRLTSVQFEIATTTSTTLLQILNAPYHGLKIKDGTLQDKRFFCLNLRDVACATSEQKHCS